jgi:hypothetical protein
MAVPRMQPSVQSKATSSITVDRDFCTSATVSMKGDHMLPAELMVDVLKGVVARGYKMMDLPNVPETWEQKGAMLISKDGVVMCLVVAVVHQSAHFRGFQRIWYAARIAIGRTMTQ